MEKEEVAMKAKVEKNGKVSLLEYPRTKRKGATLSNLPLEVIQEIRNNYEEVGPSTVSKWLKEVHGVIASPHYLATARSAGKLSDNG
jgi:hypothetical protein